MTEVQDATQRKARRMHNIGRALAVAWAAYWTLWSGLLTGPSPSEWSYFGLGNWLTLAALVLPSWISVAIAWQWQRVGAVLLLLGGFVLPTALFYGPIYGALVPSEVRDGRGLVLLIASPLLLPMFVLAVLAGSLLLLGWRKETTSRPIHDQIPRSRWIATLAISVLAMLTLLGLLYWLSILANIWL